MAFNITYFSLCKAVIDKPCIFIYLFFFYFSDARPDQTRRPIWVHSTSKDAVSRKDESFGKYIGYKFRGVLPQKPPPKLNLKSN